MGSKGSKPKVPSITFNFSSPPSTEGTTCNAFPDSSFLSQCVCALLAKTVSVLPVLNKHNLPTLISVNS